MRQPTEQQLILFSAARLNLVSHPRPQEGEEASVTRGGSGPNSAGWLRNSSRPSSVLRTLLASALCRNLGLSWIVWKRVDTKSKWSRWAPVTSGPHSGGIGSGSSAWPTPRAGEAKQGPSSTEKHLLTGDLMLSDVAKLWAAPRARDQRGPGIRGDGSVDLSTQVIGHASGHQDLTSENPGLESLRANQVLPRPLRLRLNVDFVTWLQNFPRGWLDVGEGAPSGDSGTPSCPPAPTSLDSL